jgi:hypothetical protein
MTMAKPRFLVQSKLMKGENRQRVEKDQTSQIVANLFPPFQLASFVDCNVNPVEKCDKFQLFDEFDDHLGNLSIDVTE